MITRLAGMRILILTPRLPWPPLDGGRVAMSRLAQSLANSGAEVEVLSLNPRKHRGAVEGPLPIRAVDIDTSRLAGPMLRSAFGDVPYVVARFVSRAFREAIAETLTRFRPDVVQIESPFLLPYVATIRTNSNATVVLRSLNVEFRIWEGLALAERNPLRRFALRRIAASLRDYELRAMESVDAVVPISADDAADFRALGCTRPMQVTPCGVFLSEAGTSAVEPNVGFIGSLDFRPNQNAVLWIADELWPRVIQRAPEAKLSIAGSSPPDWLRERLPEIHANVPDPAAFLRSLAVVIAPLRAGGGMRIKVLEAMALGKPIVATSVGAGGIDVHDGEDILIADDPDAFADAVVRLLRGPGTAARIGAAARETVAKRYASDRLAAELLHFYATQITSRSTSSAPQEPSLSSRAASRS
jgi:glycosyltransferase involved in cell wall biosynthesis